MQKKTTTKCPHKRCPCGKLLNGSPFGVCSSECAGKYIDGRGSNLIIKVVKVGKITATIGANGGNGSNRPDPLSALIMSCDPSDFRNEAEMKKLHEYLSKKFNVTYK